MPTTQNEDLNERVNHPRHYNQHVSGIECIELIEHLPCNLANAVKYIWRCGLKATETPIRDLMSAKWYVEREIQRIDLYELDRDPTPKTDVVWRALARRVIIADVDSLLADCLDPLLQGDLESIRIILENAIHDLENEAP